MRIKKCLILLLFAVFAGCTAPMNMNTVVNEPNFSGIVEEVYDGSILVRVNEGEDERKSSDLMSVSLNTMLADSMTHFSVGDEVRVYYDGYIAESYPAQIHSVYAITLVTPQDR